MAPPVVQNRVPVFSPTCLKWSNWLEVLKYQQKNDNNAKFSTLASTLPSSC